MSSEDLPIDGQRAVIMRQIAAWREKRFDVQIAHKVHAQLKSTPEVLARLIDELTMCEKALALLDAELAERA